MTSIVVGKNVFMLDVKETSKRLAKVITKKTGLKPKLVPNAPWSDTTSSFLIGRRLSENTRLIESENSATPYDEVYLRLAVGTIEDKVVFKIHLVVVEPYGLLGSGDADFREFQYDQASFPLLISQELTDETVKDVIIPMVKTYVNTFSTYKKRLRVNTRSPSRTG